VVDTMTDPMMVKAIDNFRRLSENSDKGIAKRKKIPVKRVPTKKPSNAKTKKSNKIDAARKAVSKGRATEKDESILFDNVIDSIFDN
jgi:electron transfer flavoprotein alpha subunit